MNMNLKKIENSPLYIVLVLIVIILSWNLYKLREKNNKLNTKLASINSTSDYSLAKKDTFFKPLSDSTLPHFKLPVIREERKISSAELKNKPHILILFKTNDCSYCLSEIPFWEQISAVFSDRLSVVGVIRGKTLQNCEHFLRLNHIHIPVLYDDKGILFKSIKVDQKGAPRPIKAFINTKGKILDRSKTTYNDALLQIQYCKKIQYLLGKNSTI